MVDIPRIIFFAQRRYRANWPFVDGHKFAFLSVAAPVWQGAKVQEYRDISSFRNAARRGAAALENVTFFA
jgi:hypothetical protein